jgi:hypothetical protein
MTIVTVFTFERVLYYGTVIGSISAGIRMIVMGMLG